MIPFETYLMKNGWDKYRYDFNLNKSVLANNENHFVCRNYNLSYSYKKDGKTIEIGYGEFNKPVAILYPNLYFKDGNNIKTMSQFEMINLTNEYKNDFDSLLNLLIQPCSPL
jgi:hypothetical protein